MKKIKFFSILICFILLTPSFLFVGCNSKEKKQQEELVRLTNQEIVAESIEKTEKLLTETTNGKNYTNPADPFLETNKTSQSKYQSLSSFDVEDFDSFDGETRKMGVYSATLRLYGRIVASLGAMDYILNHFTAEDGYGIDLQYNKVYKYDDGESSNYYKLIENENSIVLICDNETIIVVGFDESKTRATFVKGIDLYVYDTVNISEYVLNFDSNSFSENLIRSKGDYNEILQDLINKSFDFNKVCSYGVEYIHAISINANGELKALTVEEGTRNDDVTKVANVYNDIYNDVKDVFDYYENIMSDDIQENTVVFEDAHKIFNSCILVEDREIWSFYVFRVDYDNMIYILNKLKTNLEDEAYSDESWDDEKQLIEESLSYVQTRGEKKYIGILSDFDCRLSEDKSYLIAEISEGKTSICFEIKEDSNCTIVNG